MRPIPTITELQETISNDLRSRLNITGSLKRVLNAFTGVFAALFKLVYYFLSDIQNNIFPDTADTEANGGTLERIGRIYLGRNPLPATVGVFEFIVAGVTGSVIRAGLTFKSNDDSKSPGQLYVTDAEYTLTGSGDIIEARSLGAGVDYDLNLDDELTITEPVIGVNRTVTVSDVLTQPTASESIEDYRQKVLDAIQLEPQGGAKTDYRLWAADVAGVRRVYPYVRDGAAGIVDVYVEATVVDSTDGYGTPSTSILEDVLEVIEFDPDETRPLNERGRRPIQAILDSNSVQTIDLAPVDVEITGLTPNTTAIRNAIRSNIEAYLFTVRPYIAGADLPRSKNDVLYSARVQSVATDVLENGGFFTSLEMFVSGIGVQSNEFTLGTIPYLRNLTFV